MSQFLLNALISLAAIALVFPVSSLVSATEPEPEVRTIRVLTIGNSFADNACRYLPQIFGADASVELVLMQANLGGCSLERHWKNAVAAQAGTGGKAYRLHRKPASLQQMLAAEPWDVVTLQQVSNNSWLPKTYHPYAENLVMLIGQKAPQATISFHQTWAYRTDAPLLSTWNISQAEMYEQLTDAYSQVAKQFKTSIIPAGAAVQAYRQRPDRHYGIDQDFDFQSPPATGLPRQDNSLVVGWTRNKATQKLQLDPKHMNNRGEYLIGAVWYEALTGHDIRENRYVPPGIPEEELNVLQTVAHETVASFKQPAVPLGSLEEGQQKTR